MPVENKKRPKDSPPESLPQSKLPLLSDSLELLNISDDKLDSPFKDTMNEPITKKDMAEWFKQIDTSIGQKVQELGTRMDLKVAEVGKSCQQVQNTTEEIKKEMAEAQEEQNNFRYQNGLTKNRLQREVKSCNFLIFNHGCSKELKTFQEKETAVDEVFKNIFDGKEWEKLKKEIGIVDIHILGASGPIRVVTKSCNVMKILRNQGIFKKIGDYHKKNAPNKPKFSLDEDLPVSTGIYKRMAFKILKQLKKKNPKTYVNRLTFAVHVPGAKPIFPQKFWVEYKDILNEEDLEALKKAQDIIQDKRRDEGAEPMDFF